MQSRKVFLGTSFIQVSKINTDSNGSLLFIDRDNVRYPFHQGYWINNPSFEKFLNFSFNSYSLPRMYLPKFLLDRFIHGISSNLMDHNGRVNPRHLFIGPGKNIMEFLKKCLICFRFICGAVFPNRPYPKSLPPRVSYVVPIYWA